MFRLFKAVYLTVYGTIALTREQWRIEKELAAILPRVYFNHATRHGSLRKVTVILLTKRNKKSYPLAKLSCGHWVYTRSRTQARCASCFAWKRAAQGLKMFGIAAKRATKAMVGFGKLMTLAKAGKRKGIKVKFARYKKIKKGD